MTSSPIPELEACRGCGGFTTHFEGCPVDDGIGPGTVRADQRGPVEYETVPWDRSADRPSADQPAQRAQPPEPSPSPSSFSPWPDADAPLRLHYAREAEVPPCPVRNSGVRLQLSDPARQINRARRVGSDHPNAPTRRVLELDDQPTLVSPRWERERWSAPC